MEVDAAVRGDAEEVVREFLAEGDDDEAVGFEGAEEVEDVGGVGVFGAGEREVVGEGRLRKQGWGSGAYPGRRGGRAGR